MGIKVVCSKCKKELTKPGGLAFSPPKGYNCVKFHLCYDCWKKFLEWVTPCEAQAETIFSRTNEQGEWY